MRQSLRECTGEWLIHAPKRAGKKEDPTAPAWWSASKKGWTTLDEATRFDLNEVAQKSGLPKAEAQGICLVTA